MYEHVLISNCPILASANPAPEIRWATDDFNSVSRTNQTLRTSVVSITESNVSKLLTPNTKLFQCESVYRPWLVDRLDAADTVSDLYFDWPKWARHIQQVPVGVFDFSVLIGDTLTVVIDSVPKSLSGYTLIVYDKLDATSGTRYTLTDGSIATESALFIASFDEENMILSASKFQEVGDFGFQIEFFDMFGSLGHTNIYQYSVFDKPVTGQPTLEPISSQALVSKNIAFSMETYNV